MLILPMDTIMAYCEKHEELGPCGQCSIEQAKLEGSLLGEKLIDLEKKVDFLKEENDSLSRQLNLAEKHLEAYRSVFSNAEKKAGSPNRLVNQLVEIQRHIQASIDGAIPCPDNIDTTEKFVAWCMKQKTD